MGLLIVIVLALAALDLWSAAWLAGMVGTLATLGLLVIIPLMLNGLLRRARLASMNCAAQLDAESSSPAGHLAESGLLLVAGMAAFFPGFVSDILAALLLVPAIRGWASRLLLARLKSLNAGPDGGSTVRVWTFGGSPFAGAETAPRPMKYVRNESIRP